MAQSKLEDWSSIAGATGMGGTIKGDATKSTAIEYLINKMYEVPEVHMQFDRIFCSFNILLNRWVVLTHLQNWPDIDENFTLIGKLKLILSILARPTYGRTNVYHPNIREVPSYFFLASVICFTL